LNPWDKSLDQIRAVAQLNCISSVSDYCQYFEERIGKQRHFGEVSPSYSHLPAEAYQCMSRLTEDVRFLFVMRDPTRRAASHMRHLRLMINKDKSLPELLERVGPSHTIYIKSDYRYPLRTLRSLGLADRCRFMIYEDLFKQDSLDSLCDWLGLARHKANVEKALNVGMGEHLTPQQLEELRERLAPIYEGLRHDPVTKAASRWWW
ncbi:MAG: hypothetical protein VKK97_12235, partial [Synechococcaceae cyanobacterium]|nr:hypothetical protein [Synechococcaceae cyanobacterium]